MATNVNVRTGESVDPQKEEREGKVREVGCQAVWSLSSCKPGFGVEQLRDNCLETYWQSDGPQPHLVNVQFRRKTTIQDVCIYADYKLDESYTPNRPKRYNDKDEENLSNDTEETENLHENENIGNLNQHAKKRPVLETVQRYHPSKKFLSSQHLIAPMLNFLKSNTRSKNEQENPFLIFCKGLLPDYEQLTSKRQRLFKEKMMFFINSLLDEQESESSINNFCAPTIAHNGTISGRYTFIHSHVNNISPLSKNDLTEEPKKTI